MLTHEQLEAYIATRVIQKVLSQSGSAPTRASLRTALLDARVLTIAGQRVQLQPARPQGRAGVTLTVVSKDGLLIQ